MMRRLVARHHGRLPLDTVESIWRVIIATFTWVQAPYTVHADFSAGDAAMRDVARFHFGFTVPFVPHMGAAGAVAAVAASKGDLGWCRRRASAATAPGGGRWTADDAPKIIARLPFVERADHPAGLPTFVVARPAPDAVANEVRTVSVRVAGWGPQVAAALSPLVDTVAAPDACARRRGAAGVAAAGADAGGGAGRHAAGGRLGPQYGPRRRPRQPLYRGLRRGRAGAGGPLSRSADHAMPIRTPDRLMPAFGVGHERARPPAAAPGVLAHRALRAGQERRARRRQGAQAVVQRDAARPKPAGRSPPTRRWPTSSSSIPDGAVDRAARGDRRAPTASTPPASSAAPARTRS